MILEETYKLYENDANFINGWRNMSKTQLANGYCDNDENGNIILRDHFFSGLMCKYWYMIPIIAKQSNILRLDLDDFQFMVAESLLIGLKYRRWRDSSFEVSKDPNGAEKVFHQCITSTRQRYFKYYNQDKRKINLLTSYLDVPIESINFNGYESECGEDTLLDTIIDDTSYENDEYDNCVSIVDHYVKNGDVTSAIIIDGICFQNCFSDNARVITKIDGDGNVHKEKVKGSHFSKTFLIRYLKELNTYSFRRYFTKKYEVGELELERCISKFISSKNYVLSKIVDNTLNSLRNNDYVRGVLC